jgi:hypothetical protein
MKLMNKLVKTTKTEVRERLLRKIFVDPGPVGKSFQKLYQLWARGITDPIQKQIDWQELEVKHVRRTAKNRAKATTVQASYTMLLKTMTANPLESEDRVIQRISQNLSNQIQELVDREPIRPWRAFVVKPYEAEEDRVVLRKQHIGVYGWMEVYFE